MTSDVEKEVLKNLRHPDVAIRKKAVFQAGEKKIKEAISILIDLLKNDEDSVVRNSAARALGKIADPNHKDEIFEALKESVNDPDYYVKQNVCWALGKLKDSRAIPILEKMVDPAQRLYTKAGHLKETDAKAANEASENLREEGIKYSDVIIKAIKALGDLKDPAGINALVKALGDEDDGTVRCAAALAMGKINSPEAVPHLIKALNDKYWYVRRDAAKALFKIKDKRAAPALAAKINDMYDQVRENALKALLAIGKPAAKTIFKLYLKKPSLQGVKQFITKNLTPDDLKKILEELVQEASSDQEKAQYQQILNELLSA